jgi:hypothetical protein
MKYQQKGIDNINRNQPHKGKLKIIINIFVTNTIINIQNLKRFKMNHEENFHLPFKGGRNKKRKASQT